MPVATSAIPSLTPLSCRQRASGDDVCTCNHCCPCAHNPCTCNQATRARVGATGSHIMAYCRRDTGPSGYVRAAASWPAINFLTLRAERCSLHTVLSAARSAHVSAAKNNHPPTHTRAHAQVGFLRPACPLCCFVRAHTQRMWFFSYVVMVVHAHV
jgi:hypothetical protein